MKSKLTISIASILSVLVLVGVGFAAWVIINPSVKKDAESTITAETVTDKSYTLEASFAADEKIVFGAPETMNNSNAWFTADDKTAKEDLTAKLTLTLNYKDWSVIPNEFSVTMKTKKGKDADTVFNSLRDGTYPTLTGTLANKNFIADPKITYGSTTTADVTTADVTMNGVKDAVKIAKTAFKGYDATNTTTEKTVTLDITITFGWGTYFTVENTGVVNPYIFYNGKNYEETRAEANTVINAIAKLNDVEYVVTIDGTTNVNGK